jgi:glycosyltransferase involved in cell wall biosynthesis
MNKICYIATVPQSVEVFLGDIVLERSKDWSVSIATNSDGIMQLNYLNAELYPIKIRRKPDIFSDLASLFSLMQLFLQKNFDVVHSITPKGGFLSMLAARLVRVPYRVHTFTGQPWSTMKGFRRDFYKVLDKFLVANATHILVDSPSQRDFLMSEGVLTSGDGFVIGVGSICGVDLQRFCPNQVMRDRIRTHLNIPPDAIVLLFMGRFNRDKGVLDLVAAFREMYQRNNSVFLLMVGSEEDIDIADLLNQCHDFSDRITVLGHAANPEHYFASSDILCLPSYREGFGQVIIEAAASGIPAVASRIYGITDAIEENTSGLLFEPGAVDELADKLMFLIENPTTLKKLGQDARERAKKLFSSEIIISKTIEFYENLPKIKRDIRRP